MKVSLTLARNSVFFVIYNQKGKPSAMVSKFVFFHSFYNCCYDVLFLLIGRNSPLPTQLHTYLLSSYEQMLLNIYCRKNEGQKKIKPTF